MSTQRPSHIDIPPSNQSDGMDVDAAGVGPGKHTPSINPDFKRKGTTLMSFLWLSLMLSHHMPSARGILKNAQSGSYSTPDVAMDDAERQQGDR